VQKTLEYVLIQLEIMKEQGRQIKKESRKKVKNKKLVPK